MSNVIPFKPKITTDEYFGGCPECGKNDGCLNLRRDHWFVCDEHRTAWFVGSNLFSGWREESEDDWKRNAAKLNGYLVVEPIHQSPHAFMVDCLKHAMRHHWGAGLRGAEFRRAVRDTYPDATLEGFNQAADEVWSERHGPEAAR